MTLKQSVQAITMASLVCASNMSFGAQAILINLDPPNIGLNDNTPVAPIGGNTGTTIGEQRRNVFQFALDTWGAALADDTPIYVGATFQPLRCSASRGTLGAASSTFVFRDFPGAIAPGTWHHSALADARFGQDLLPLYGTEIMDVISFFNSDVDDNSENCIAGTSWYYGFDGNNGRDIDFLAVVTHEINHGIGHSNFADEASGQLLGGYPDVYINHALDLTLSKTWPEMNDAERQYSATNSGNLVWNGSTVTEQAGDILGPEPALFIFDPERLEGRYEAQAATFGPALRVKQKERDLVLANDQQGITTDACEPLKREHVRNKIVLIDRGGCTFVEKVRHAQNARARGAIIVNNQPVGLPGMGGNDDSIRIPSIGITQALGEKLKSVLKNDEDDLEVAIALNRRQLAGTTKGLVRLYAPSVFAPGSSVSHWDISASPNLLMEPFITDSLEPANLDLSLALLQDIGWTISAPMSVGAPVGKGSKSYDDDDDDDDD